MTTISASIPAKQPDKLIKLAHVNLCVLLCNGYSAELHEEKLKIKKRGCRKPYRVGK